jgi:hypothetical protein
MGAYSTHETPRNTYKILIEKYGSKRPLGRCRWEDNTTMDLKLTGCEVVD